MTFVERLNKGLVLFDGAMGTQVHDLNPTAEEWDGRTGCPEVLNLTVPEKIQRIHETYLAAGADVVETNTFGASKIVLAEFDLQDRVVEINRIAAQIARRAVERYRAEKPRFVAGSMGPGTKLITLGGTDFDTMVESYALNARGLIEGGVDLIVIETCQDPLQIKAALQAIDNETAKAGIHLPKAVSLTIEATGSMLVGTDISAALAILEPFDIDILGMNCATGPEAMRPYIKQICRSFPGPVLVQPNAGLPENVDGEMVYTLKVSEYVDVLSNFIQEYGVQIVGGCCGTTPEFIRSLSKKMPELQVADRECTSRPQLASLYTAVDLQQDPGPFFIGERSNTNGSKKFREYLLEEDWDGIVDMSKQQELTGAHGLDLCVAYTGRDEIRDMHEAVVRINKQVDLPLFIDSTDVDVIDKALKLIGGRAVINSINLEEGEERANAICRLAKQFGAGLIALTIDETGMAKNVERKLEIAKRLYDIAVNRHGLRPQDLIYDALTFTLGSGEKSMRDAGLQTLDGIRRIKSALPGVYTVLGISNISFGLAPHSREILNSVFLDQAVKAGLDAAIVNVRKIIPLHRIPEADIEICLNLIFNRGDNPLFSFIEYFDAKVGVETDKGPATESLSLEEKIKHHIINGNRSGLQDLLETALEQKKAIDIINQQLIPAMKIVGDLFAEGKMQLPFVLQSAEVMKFAVGVCEPHMEKTDSRTQTSIVLATVRGDVHDIGKNLVDIILSNNGYKVYNLGIKCEIDTMLKKVEEVQADALGMSGLLVKSTVVMKENLEVMNQRGINIPVLLGGAALTESYVHDVCSKTYPGSVVYCADAFDGLNMMSIVKEGRLSDYLKQPESPEEQKSQTVRRKVRHPQLIFEHNIPTPPFWGTRTVTNIDLDTVYSYISQSVLFRGRWGYRRGDLSRQDYDDLIENKVKPELEALKQRCKQQSLLQPTVVYGYFPCNRDADSVIIFKPDSDEEILRFHFPRQKKEPFRSIADFFLPVESGVRDIMPLQVATVGQRATEESQRLYEANAYKDYLLFHGLSVEAAEALAEYWHQEIRRELAIDQDDGSGIEDYIVQKYRGSRYSFGYPACPDLHGNRQIGRLLKVERINVYITDEDQMTPEQTTSAFIVHHPQAKYFTLE